jgi:hypothetical protein
MKFIIGFGKKINDILADVRIPQNEFQKTRTDSPDINTTMAAYELDDTLSSSYTAIPIASRKTSIISPTQRIRNMRNLKAPTRGSARVYFNKDIELFVLQAKYMEDFEDNFGKTLSFNTYSPTYADLNTKQLRCYFTWRTKVRQGIVKKTSLSCVYIYVYEIINNIGVTDPLDGFAKLIFIWQRYRKIDEHLDRYLVNWIKDYYICNDFAVSFADLVLKYKLEQFYPGVITDEEARGLSLEKLNSISNYKLEKSKFLTTDNTPLYAKCVLCVMINLQPLFELYGLSLSEVINGKAEQHWYRPFRNAIYHPVQTKNIRVSISYLEIYEYENGNWRCEKNIGVNASTAALVGYVMKRTEAALRVSVGYKYKLSPAIATLIQALQGHHYTASPLIAALQDENFDKIIDETVAESYKVFLNNADFSENDIAVPLVQQYLQLIQTTPFCAFCQMRRIKLNDDSAKQFFEQAKLTENLTDDFSEPLEKENHTSIYAQMTNNELRAYFTWRTKIRAGEHPAANMAHIRLYAYELIHNIGAVDIDDAVKKMADILLHYGASMRSIYKFMISLIKDYYLCNSFDMDFVDFAKKYHIEPYFPNVFLSLGLSDNWFALYSQLSNYKILESRFYTQSSAPMIAACFNAVIGNVTSYFKNEGLSLEEVMVGNSMPEHWWQPFKNAPYFQRTKTPNKKVTLCANESYECKNGEWFCLSFPQRNPAGAHIAGYIIKRIEARMREITQFKYKLSPDVSALIDALPSGTMKDKQVLLPLLANPSFDRTIDDAVSEYFKANHPRVFADPQSIFTEPVKVNIDTTQLDAIRKNAAGNQERLTVPSDDEGVEIGFAPKAVEPPLPIDENMSGGWDGLYAQMAKMDKQALSIILAGENITDKLLALSQENGGLMVEVMVETINELALRCVGDNIIESSGGNVNVYNEYIDNIRQIMGRDT